MVSVNCQAQDTCTVFSQRNNWELGDTDMSRAVLAQCVNHLVCVPAVSIPKFVVPNELAHTATVLKSVSCTPQLK